MKITDKTVKGKNSRQNPVFMDLTNDYAFKLVFATPGHEEALLQLVRCLLPEKDIVSVQLSAQEQMSDTEKLRRGIYDVSCQTASGDFLEIEMQVRKQNDFGDRMVFYSSFPVRNFVGKLDSGLEYAFTPIYVIGILDFIMSDVMPNDRFMNSYSIRNDFQHEILLSDHLHFITIELPKFQKSLEELENSTDELAFIFNNIGKMNEIPPILRNKGFEKMFEMSKFAAMDEKEIIEYYARQKDIIDLKGALSSARRDGLEEGRAEGLEEGREKGHAEEKHSIAKAMKAKGISADIIQQCTGLSEAEIQAL